MVSKVSEASQRKSEPMAAKIKENIQIIVDDRERPSGVLAELENLDGAEVKIEHLALGDYCVDGAVLIERKSAGDFRSIVD
jgi:ERCC4-type nuclease